MREVRKWEIRVGFAEEETCKQRPGGADGGSWRTLGKNILGRGRSKDKLSKANMSSAWEEVWPEQSE